MTNLEAYIVTYKNPNGEGAGRLTLSINGLDPDGSDQNELAFAYAIYDQITAPDFTQGGTNETLSESARQLLIRKAEAIFVKNGKPNLFGFPNSEISGVAW